jgi:hypothetical protein
MSSGQPTPGTPAADKIQNIVAKLGQYQDALNSKRTLLLSQELLKARPSMRRRTAASIGCIDEVIKLVTRVQVRWQQYTL